MDKKWDAQFIYMKIGRGKAEKEIQDYIISTDQRMTRDSPA